jgi:hypothetical protein
VTAIINYTPPPTVRDFIKDYRKGELFYDWIVGPVGSGKTTGIFFKLVRMATMQAPGPDGIRRTRAVIVRNTMPQLRDTTITSWNYWFKDGEAGTWHATTNRFVLRFGDVECEVLFRPLDTAADVARVLSLEVTFALLDEFTQIPRDIVDALSGRLGRYPSKKDGGATNWGMWGSSNPDTEDNWWFDYLHNNPAIQRHLPVLQDDDAAEMMHDILGPGGGRRRGANGRTSCSRPACRRAPRTWRTCRASAAYYTNMDEGQVRSLGEAVRGGRVGLLDRRQAGHPELQGRPPHREVALLLQPHAAARRRARPGARRLGHDPRPAGPLHGRLLVLGELVQSGLSAEELVIQAEALPARPLPGIDMNSVIIAPDPAAANRSQTDKKTVVEVFAAHFTVKPRATTGCRCASTRSPLHDPPDRRRAGAADRPGRVPDARAGAEGRLALRDGQG